MRTLYKDNLKQSLSVLIPLSRQHLAKLRLSAHHVRKQTMHALLLQSPTQTLK